MMNLTDPDALTALPLLAGLPPPSQLQREIEEMGAHELRRAFLALQADAAKAPSTHTLTLTRMAIANEGGPAGEVYTVVVTVRREPPRD